MSCSALKTSHHDSEKAQASTNVLKVAMHSILERYYAQTPTARAVVDHTFTAPGGYGADNVFHDHFAFRTFAVPGLGIESIGSVLVSAFGYTRREPYVFPTKKLDATWFAPPQHLADQLPRVFVSELRVGDLSPDAQRIIERYTSPLACLDATAAWTAVLTGALPWATPNHADYSALLQESEYAAWVLVNGYRLNHTTVALHRVAGLNDGIDAFSRRLSNAGFVLNTEGGTVKASPDGLLLQSSTVADVLDFTFDDGQVHPIVGSYLEFAERLPLPKFAHLPLEQLSEAQRRDGFEAASADKIFASTTLASGGLMSAKK